MPKGSSKSTAAIQRLLEERRQYESWIARINAAADATPEEVRTRVRADYEARLKAVTEELKTHAEAARQLILQRREFRIELQGKETQAAERLKEAELRHAVGEYDESQWTQVHKDVLAELVSVREELQSVEADIEKLEELDKLVRQRPAPGAGAPATPSPADRHAGRGAPPPRPQFRSDDRKDSKKPAQVDELAFLKSVTEDEKGGAPSPRRASGAQFQPAIPDVSPRSATPAPSSSAPTPAAPSARTNDDDEAPRTLKCKECGTMNLPTEWYCEQCGAELAAL
ncbi:MAG: hypothetical protein ACREL9_06030 [Gemmatimonadales bacterium]